MDSSGSITEDGDENWELVLEMVRLLIQSIDSYSTIGVTSRVAIINYSSTVEVVADLSEKLNKDQLLSLINNGAIVYFGKGTEMFRAVEEANELFLANVRIVSGSIQATQAMILFTDGRVIVPPVALFITLMDRGVHVILIGKCTLISFALVNL